MRSFFDFEDSEPALEVPRRDQRAAGDENITQVAKLEDGKLYVKHTHDVEPILRANHHQRQEQGMRHGSEVFNHVARIDMAALKNWCQQRGMGRGWWQEFNQDGKLLKEFLNDPDNKIWRTRLGKI